ncbi:MAG TPA: M15 family metallopeptidase [Gallionellaceae bacterium]|nr:M15 family metallopeptidase [Gallionellaceae bacterium]
MNVTQVSHPYAQLQADEIDAATGCTVCMEDQQVLQVGRLPPFRVCRKIAGKVRERLEQLLAEGGAVLEVTAYRPGRTRNPLDEYGNRTGFSNHAYGAAIDINRSTNGLYDHCGHFGPGCRLIQGGAWRPGNFGALTGDSFIVRSMKASGFKWGGEIAGEQKDFMHFSLTGY